MALDACMSLQLRATSITPIQMTTNPIQRSGGTASWSSSHDASVIKT
jgi:hypothetical protein